MATHPRPCIHPPIAVCVSDLRHVQRHEAVQRLCVSPCRMTLFLVVLAACMAVASEYFLTRANPGVRLPLWRGRPPCNPTSARVLRGLALGSACLLYTSDAADE